MAIFVHLQNLAECSIIDVLAELDCVRHCVGVVVVAVALGVATIG